MPHIQITRLIIITSFSNVYIYYGINFIIIIIFSRPLECRYCIVSKSFIFQIYSIVRVIAVYSKSKLEI